jgi:hypothetical protein
MSICKLSFAKSRSIVDPARGTGASEIPRNEAYIEVRPSASGPECLRPGGMRDKGNAADGRFPTAASVENKERKPGVEAGSKDGKLIGIDQYPYKNKEYATCDGDNPHMLLESVEVFEESVDAKRGEEKRESQTQRIDHEK